MEDSLDRVSGAIALAATLAAGMILWLANPWLLFLPIAVWMGWLQIGSL
jgi:hypothetical protein